MLTCVFDDCVEQYVQQTLPARREDLLQIIEMMRAVAPEAELVNDLGIPYFKLCSGWLYGVAARVDHICIYFSDLSVLHSFRSRLPRAQFGDDCLIIHRLDDINLNVFMELLGQIKVHFFINHQESSDLN
ncbi:hypothetical protein C0J08_16530 [Marinomonas sp. CT5]|uniref:DUF1801 domain-containing protein n=1 Tax=Marinomonas sp. CT5 TaxID=2066133 RepID=UPI001BB01BA1|nr:DUF1801 domain-containing protein [Marinomonas sp. CT5]QUX96908.1 hypothetical protein C0J08_16530 [Marinomonas sp. CT5]